MVSARSIFVVGLIGVTFVSPLWAQQSPHPDVLARAKAATDMKMDCYGRKVERACEAMIAELKAAMALPQATASDRHSILKEKLNAITVYGEALVESGNIRKALSLLRAGEAEMLSHNSDGKHFHAFTDNIGLQRELVKAYYSVGRLAEADIVIARTRDAVAQARKYSLHYADSTDVARRDYFKQMGGQALVSGEAFESQLSDHLLTLMEASESEKALQRRALDHAVHAVEMTEATAMGGIQAFGDDLPEMRLVRALDRRGRLEFSLALERQAGNSFLDGAAWACMLEARLKRSSNLTNAQRTAEGLPAKELEGVFMTRARESCQAMAVKWAVIAPRDTAAAEAAFDRWMHDSKVPFDMEIIPKLSLWAL